jgi:hypothetical protein
MIEPNGWHHHERVYIQGHSSGMTLIQYVERAKVRPMLTTGGSGVKRLSPMYPWRWVLADEVVSDSELDDLVRKAAQAA